MAVSSSTPSIPMLSIPEKKPSSVDLYNPLRSHIASSRAIAVIKSRLNVMTISFTWQDAFKTNKRATQKSMDFEKAAIVFNIERGTDEERKMACVEFQKASGAFRLLKENIIASKVPGPTTVDLTVECAGMLEKLMLAHAQECYFDKAIADSKSPVICSKIAKQVGIFYAEAYKALNSQPLNQHFDKSWVPQIQLKSAYFYAEACYLYCTELHQKEEIGEEVARLKLGISALSDAKKSVRGVPASLMNLVTKLESNMNRNLQRAEKENNEVYLIRIPPVSSLMELTAALLVKSASMADALDISNENLFSNFIPHFMKNSHAKYSKMVVFIL
ncbi:hypothetical protein LUZ60_016607 [Juncus effusus]|nr:hypothetical protein LUZ60_016607 [Juncus effusus]